MRFHFLTQFSTDFGQQGLKMTDNPVFHHIMKKNVCFFYKNSEIWSKKGVLDVGFLGKHQSEVNKFWRAAKQGSHFWMIFKCYTQVLILSKSSEKLWFSKIISQLSGKIRVCTLAPKFFQNHHLSFDFDEFFCELSLFDWTKFKVFSNWASPLKCWNLHLISDFDEILYEKSLFECRLRIKTKNFKNCKWGPFPS